MHRTTALALFLCMATMPSANAAEDLLLGFRSGIISMEFDDATLNDSFLMATVFVGYEYMETKYANLSAAVELNTSLTAATYGNDEYAFDSWGLSTSAQTKGSVSYIVRVGYVSSEQNFNVAPNVEDDATLVALGVGFESDLNWEVYLDSYDFDAGNSALYLNVGVEF